MFMPNNFCPLTSKRKEPHCVSSSAHLQAVEKGDQSKRQAHQDGNESQANDVVNFHRSGSLMKQDNVCVIYLASMYSSMQHACLTSQVGKG